MSIVLQSTGGGSVTINEPSTASNFTQTLPAATGDVMVSGNMPAFSVYISADQSITSNTNTKVAFDTEIFDTNNCWNTSTYRFTPTVAGYYQINLNLWVGNTTVITRWIGKIYKNGAVYSYTTDLLGTQYGGCGSCVVYCNGTTDYIEGYVQITGTSPSLIGANSHLNNMSGSLIRAA
jgi:hypothetical protein